MKNSTFINMLRKSTMLFVALCSSAMAQEVFYPIDLTFTAEGESSVVESVTVTNLSQPSLDPVILNGTDILHLYDPARDPDGIESVPQAKSVSQPILTPNPSMGDGTLIFDTKQEGPVHVSIYSQSGILMETAVLNATKGRNTARIPSQQPGIYIVSINAGGQKTSTRWICGGTKSFSGIALGGAGQWADVTLPTQSAPTKRKSAKVVANVVEMTFHEGDILRFEGKSGQMRTIVVNAPKQSHSVPFYFHPCRDVSGNNYPIIEAGGLLWMAEDLRAVQGLDGVSIYYDDETADWASAAQNKESAAMAMSVADDDIYYTYTAARKALPEGWRLPTLGELDAVVQNLGGYDVAGDKMKRSGDRQSFREKRTAMPDSLQLRIMPKGCVGENGVLTETNNGFILSETREQNKALYMKISNGSTAASLTPDAQVCSSTHPWRASRSKLLCRDDSQTVCPGTPKHTPQGKHRRG